MIEIESNGSKMLVYIWTYIPIPYYTTLQTVELLYWPKERLRWYVHTSMASIYQRLLTRNSNFSTHLKSTHKISSFRCQMTHRDGFCLKLSWRLSLIHWSSSNSNWIMCATRLFSSHPFWIRVSNWQCWVSLPKSVASVRSAGAVSAVDCSPWITTFVTILGKAFSAEMRQ